MRFYRAKYKINDGKNHTEIPMITEEELREEFKKDRYAKKNGIEIVKVDENGSEVRAEIHDCHLNGNDVVHGGMLFTIAACAFGVAANFRHPDTVTSGASITYLAPCRDTAYIKAEGKELSVHKHTCVYEVTVTDDKGKTVCLAQINGFIKQAVPETKD